MTPEADALAAAVSRLQDRTQDPHVCGMHNEMTAVFSGVAAELSRVGAELQASLGNIALEVKSHVAPDGPAGHPQRHELVALDRKVDAIQKTVDATAEETKGIRDDLTRHEQAAAVEKAMDTKAIQEHATRETTRTQRFVALCVLVGTIVTAVLMHLSK